MRIQGLAVAALIVVALAGCAPTPTPVPSASSTPTPTAAPVAAPGESALPVGCAELLSVADVADLGPDDQPPLAAVIDEHHIAIDMSVADLQRGALRCVWAARYSATDVHPEIRVTVSPSAATVLDPDSEPLGGLGAWQSAGGEDDTIAACSTEEESPGGPAYTSCRLVQLRLGYRIDLETIWLKRAPGAESDIATGLLASVDAAIDSAGPARTITEIATSGDPAAVCAAPEVVAIVTARGATGAPDLTADETFAGVTRCDWPVGEPYGNGLRDHVTVLVLPGGAWAMPRLATGVPGPLMTFAPAAGGAYLVGTGAGLAAFRAIGDDLVEVDASVLDGDPAVWEALLAANW